ncbi:MAG: amidohydrolase [Deltaproteobacteria bacterium]|nr:amidohydrolase [Deltaproteobacteria bacterium]MCL5792145.1 amidohydrolase [Deltaproteobacteria bacterium]
MQRTLTLKTTIKDIVKSLKPSLINLSHDIWSHPEIALEEFRTRDAICDYLSAHGFNIKKSIGGINTSFIATYGHKPHPAIAYLSEMDALPELGHACGHNVNACISAGAAVALSKSVNKDKCTIAVIGTPAEEIGFGKPELIRHGIFKPFDAAIMSHASTKRMSFRCMLALKKVKISFKGKSAHAASYPEQGKDALSALILTINNINAKRSMFKPYMHANFIITRGGTAPNIIPDFAEAYYYVRAKDLKELDELMEHVRTAVKGAGLATGTKYNIIEQGYTQYPFKINNALVRVYDDVLKELGLKKTRTDPCEGMGSSDIGNLSYIIPTLHASTPIGKDAHIHTNEFKTLAVSKTADSGILEGATTLGMTGCKIINNPGLLS